MSKIECPWCHGDKVTLTHLEALKPRIDHPNEERTYVKLYCDRCIRVMKFSTLGVYSVFASSKESLDL